MLRLPMYLSCLVGLMACSSSSNKQDETAVEEEFVLSEDVSSALQVWADSVLEPQQSLTWASENLLPEPYEGQLRSPIGVLAGLMGNEPDRCRFVHHLLSAQEIFSRYATDGDLCSIEALVDGNMVHVPTSLADNHDITGWIRRSRLPDEKVHTLLIQEELTDATGQVTVHDLYNDDLWRIEQQHIAAQYSEDASQLLLYIGAEAVQGESLGDTVKHSLLFTYTDPEGEQDVRKRQLFDSASLAGNQVPQSNDQYSFFIGSYLVDEPFIHLLQSQLELGEGGRLLDALRMRALELALQSDFAAYQIIEETEPVDGFHYTSPRIIVAAQEQHGASEQEVGYNFDLLRNKRTLIEGEEHLHFVFGLTDAFTEDALIERITGQPGLSAISVFTSLFSETPRSVQSREQMLESVLSRLSNQGIDQDRLLLSDPETDYTLVVQKQGVDLVLILDTEEQDMLYQAMGDMLDEWVLTDDGILLDGTSRTWPIMLLFLEQGSSLQHRIAVQSKPAVDATFPLLAKSHVLFEGQHQGEAIKGSALVRSFGTGTDEVDWHVYKSGVHFSSGISSADTPSIADSLFNTRFLQFTHEPATSAYETPLWLHPAIAADIRTQTPVTLRIAFETGTASSFEQVDFEAFSTATQSLIIDGQEQEVDVITAASADGQFVLSMLAENDSRLVVASSIPTSSWQLTEIITPQNQRFEGRVVKALTSTLSDLSYDIGIGDASISLAGASTQTWPDGSFSMLVENDEAATLNASIGMLVDSSYSMNTEADPDCLEDCPSRIDIVLESLVDLITGLDQKTEMALWTLSGSSGSQCPSAYVEVHPWSLSRTDIIDRIDNLYMTGGTPLASSVPAALEALQEGIGGKKILILMSDGENTCADAVTDMELPDNVEIHTIGIGIEEGTTIEQDLMWLASETGGTYQRTVNAADLQAALVSVGELSIPETQSVEESIRITADTYASLDAVCASGMDNQVYTMEALPEQTAPAFVTLQPDEPWPSEVQIAIQTQALIEEHRAANPNLLIVMPNQEASVGGWDNAFAWYEVDMVTLETTTLTHDGLHGAVVASFAASVLGLWAGVDGIMESFGNCILSSTGCGSNVDEIRDNICKAEGESATVASLSLAMLTAPFDAAAGVAINQSFTTAVALVEARCRGEFNSSEYAMDTGANFAGGYLGAEFGPVVGGMAGIGYTLWID